MIGADVCPTCGHQRSDYKRHAVVIVRRLLRLSPPAAECGEVLPDESGWGGVECGCKSPFHGS